MLIAIRSATISSVQSSKHYQRAVRFHPFRPPNTPVSKYLEEQTNETKIFQLLKSTEASLLKDAGTSVISESKIHWILSVYTLH